MTGKDRRWPVRAGRQEPGHDHAHQPGNAHSHGLSTDADRRYLIITLCLLGAFMLGEVIVAFASGSLALLSDLTLPKLRSRWQATGPRPGERFTAAERAAIWEHAARTAAGAAEQIRNVTATDPGAAADAAWAAGDTLHAAAAALGSRVLRQAADSYDRAARAPYGRIPSPGHPGNNLRRTARLLSSLPSVLPDAPLAEMTLLIRFARLTEAIAELREAQRLAAQAAAARRAAEHLRAAMPGSVTPPSGGRTRVRTTSAERSRAEFPFPPGTFRPGTDAAGEADSQRGARPVPSQGLSRPRGPTR